MGNEHFDVVVVGSGFGGSVMAYRLASAKQRVLLVERGNEYAPGSFPRSPHLFAKNFWDPSERLLGMLDIWSFRKLDAVSRRRTQHWRLGAERRADQTSRDDEEQRRDDQVSHARRSRQFAPRVAHDLLTVWNRSQRFDRPNSNEVMSLPLLE